MLLALEQIYCPSLMEGEYLYLADPSSPRYAEPALRRVIVDNLMRQVTTALAIQTLWLLFKEKRTVVEQRFVENLLDQSELIAHTYAFVCRFRQILAERDETALPLWAYEAEASQIPELKRFVQRLRLDWEAVENALLFASSQGQVEGRVNRLKVFKRQVMDEPVPPSCKLA